MEIKRTFDLLTNLQSFPPKEDILARKIKGEWRKYSINEYVEHSYSIAYALLTLELKPGTKVISICSNRPEWNFLDMGVALAHMVHIPIYSTLGLDDFEYIIDHSDAEVIVVGTAALYKKIAPIASGIGRDIKLIMMDDSDDVLCMGKLVEMGRQNKEKFEKQIEENVKSISPDDVASIIYTSGTTGTPKGVMLSHYNLVSNSHSHALRQTLGFEHKMLSFLPLCHVFERTMNYEYQERGISIYYAESLGTIASDLKQCQADGFCAVPRVLEMMYGKLEDAGKKLKGFKKFIYRRAWKFANEFDNTDNSFFYLLKQRIFDKLVYSKWRENLGGHEMEIVSGGSSIQAKIVRTFNAAKLRIFEGYGMTETSPVIAVNSPADGYNVIGTVGKASTGTQLKIAEDGEILTKGPHVMLGYYKNPEATAEIIDSEGWLHTGDIGCLVDGEYLKITDRKKEIFKLSAGKYIAPQAIENKLKESPFIDNAFVCGENQKFASAIIIPNKAKLSEYAAGNDKTSDSVSLLQKPGVITLLNGEVEKVNKTLAPHESIKRPVFLFDEWTTDNGMLSQTLKLKRKNLIARYSKQIAEIYKSDK